jgi:DNA invertase Pin-like site-specific DNA recombinase
MSGPISKLFVATPPERVVSYIRVSGRGQIDGDGPERQRDAIAKFCKAHGLATMHGLSEFFDKAVSGKVDGMDRPEFVRMLEQIEETNLPRVSAIVVECMDRLARDLMVSELLLAECRQRSIKVYAADQGALIDMTGEGADPTRVLIRQILGALAQWDKSMLVSKLKAARDRKKATTGRCEGKKPFGTRPGEAAIINLAHQFRSVLDENNQPMEYVVIAKHFNESGFRTRHGKPWTKYSVRHIVDTTQPTKILEID